LKKLKIFQLVLVLRLRVPGRPGRKGIGN
jgi:hypothetical protein